MFNFIILPIIARPEGLSLKKKRIEFAKRKVFGKTEIGEFKAP